MREAKGRTDDDDAAADDESARAPCDSSKSSLVAKERAPQSETRASARRTDRGRADDTDKRCATQTDGLSTKPRMTSGCDSARPTLVAR